ncbi:AIDA repeat-containing protein, partial [Escherichia coli]|uniref:AIDA repeat-containing protein n=1 Tax=Escherichia coli TaxID=562 RepID=UPI001BAF0003
RGGTATNITQHDGAALKVTTYELTVSGTNREGAFSIHNKVAETVLLENGSNVEVTNSANKKNIKEKKKKKELKKNKKKKKKKKKRGGEGGRKKKGKKKKK